MHQSEWQTLKDSPIYSKMKMISEWHRQCNLEVEASLNRRGEFSFIFGNLAWLKWTVLNSFRTNLMLIMPGNAELQEIWNMDSMKMTVFSWNGGGGAKISNGLASVWNSNFSLLTNGVGCPQYSHSNLIRACVLTNSDVLYISNDMFSYWIQIRSTIWGRNNLIKYI